MELDCARRFDMRDIFPRSEDTMIEARICNEYHQLACAILWRAVENWKNFHDVSHPDETIKGSTDAFQRSAIVGYLSPRIELLAFFWSRWCGLLCEEAGLDYEDVMKRVGVPLRTELDN